MSEQYTHILLATDLHTDNSAVIAKALSLSEQYKAKLSVIYVLESLPLYFSNDMVSPVIPDTQALEAQLFKLAQEKMSQLAERYGIDPANCHLELGVAKSLIAEFAQENAVDMIVIGSHSRHGLASLLGSTARAVLNAASCDVLAVKVSPESKS